MHEKDPVRRSYLEYKLSELSFKEVNLEYEASVLKLKALQRYESSNNGDKNTFLTNANKSLTPVDTRNLEKIFL